MRKPRLPFLLAASFALIFVSCGKNKAPGNGSNPGASNPSSGGTQGDSSDNIISGGQIVVIEDIVFKVGDLTNPYTGLVIWKHENGNRQMESYCKLGVWNGTSKWWYKNENIAGEGIYKNGEWEGEYKEWHENGKPKVQVTFKEGKEEGREFWWYPDGTVQSVTQYKAGKKEGVAFGNFESGKKSWEAGWAGNFPDGEYSEWYENGDKKSVLRYVKRARHGKEEHWYQRANQSQQEQQKSWEVTWVKNKKQGEERHWYPSGIKMKWMTFKDGEMHGEAGNFYENGRQASVRNFQDGKQVSIRQWDQNGRSVGAVGAQPVPRGRTHIWTSSTITKYYQGKPAQTVQSDFGNPDAAGPGGAWMFRKVNFIHQNKPRTATVHFLIDKGKVAQVRIIAE
jgi:antitoxin component YwqK of YwqJK toxin-antitoxin module